MTQASVRSEGYGSRGERLATLPEPAVSPLGAVMVAHPPIVEGGTLWCSKLDIEKPEALLSGKGEVVPLVGLEGLGQLLESIRGQAREVPRRLEYSPDVFADEMPQTANQKLDFWREDHAMTAIVEADRRATAVLDGNG